jgi:hypothetical protein
MISFWISVVPPKMDRALLVGMGSGVEMKPSALIFSSRPVGTPRASFEAMAPTAVARLWTYKDGLPSVKTSRHV